MGVHRRTELVKLVGDDHHRGLALPEQRLGHAQILMRVGGLGLLADAVGRDALVRKVCRHHLGLRAVLVGPLSAGDNAACLGVLLQIARRRVQALAQSARGLVPPDLGAQHHHHGVAARRRLVPIGVPHHDNADQGAVGEEKRDAGSGRPAQPGAQHAPGAGQQKKDGPHGKQGDYAGVDNAVQQRRDNERPAQQGGQIFHIFFQRMISLPWGTGRRSMPPPCLVG